MKEFFLTDMDIAVLKHVCFATTTLRSSKDEDEKIGLHGRCRRQFSSKVISFLQSWTHDAKYYEQWRIVVLKCYGQERESSKIFYPTTLDKQLELNKRFKTGVHVL